MILWQFSKKENSYELFLGNNEGTGWFLKTWARHEQHPLQSIPCITCIHVFLTLSLLLLSIASQNSHWCQFLGKLTRGWCTLAVVKQQSLYGLYFVHTKPAHSWTKLRLFLPSSPDPVELPTWGSRCELRKRWQYTKWHLGPDLLPSSLLDPTVPSQAWS